MSRDNKNWTEQEDDALRELREVRGISRWSLIAQTLEREFEIRGKSGKRCRERYQNHVNSRVKRDEWSREEEERLFALHNQRGNRWVEIARELGRSDNAVKNHYHSKLRRALRKLNRLLHDWLRPEFKPLKNNIVAKIIQTAEDYHSQPDPTQPSPAKTCYELKNKVLSYLQLTDERPNEQILTEVRATVREMNHFNKIYKKKSKPQDTRRQKVRCSHYKGKEILSLISENKRLRQPPPQPHSQEHEDSDSEEQDSPSSNEAPPAVNMPSFLPVNIAFPYQTMPTMFFYSNPLPISTTFSLPSNQSLPLSEHCSFWPIACLPTTCETGEIKSDRLSAFSNPQS